MPSISSVLGIEQEKVLYVSGAKLIEEEGERVEGSIKILNVYSIHHPKYVHQNFLILSRSRNNANRYERIEFRTSKIYYNPVLHDDHSKDLHPVKPFKWLSVDIGRDDRAVDGATEEVTCIV